jgi:hypothetical protein
MLKLGNGIHAQKIIEVKNCIKTYLICKVKLVLYKKTNLNHAYFLSDF